MCKHVSASLHMKTVHWLVGSLLGQLSPFVFCSVPSTDPTSHCKMTLPVFLSFLKWGIGTLLCLFPCILCSSRKYQCPPQGRLMEIPRGRGFQKPNFLNESMTLKWNFQRGGGFQLKNLPWEGYGYFLKHHIIKV